MARLSRLLKLCPINPHGGPGSALKFFQQRDHAGRRGAESARVGYVEGIEMVESAGRVRGDAVQAWVAAVVVLRFPRLFFARDVLHPRLHRNNHGYIALPTHLAILLSLSLYACGLYWDSLKQSQLCSMRSSSLVL